MRRPERHNAHIKLILAAVFACFLIVVLYQGGRYLEQGIQKPEIRGDHTQRYAYDQLIEADGATYRPRKDITTILLMGIDAPGNPEAAKNYRNGGQADFLRLIALDHTEKRVSEIQIDRDTMTPITVLGVLGNKSGVRTSQISLSHGFGDGREQSCELTKEAVSNLLFGVGIDFYAAVSMDAIPMINDLLGGITVTIQEDFSALDAEMTPGKTMTLTGTQAELFVRGRKGMTVGTNEARMARQEMYLSAASEQLRSRIRQDEDFVGHLYDALADHLITDMPRGRMINEVWNSQDYPTAVIKPAGVHQLGADGYMQFYPDLEQLQSVILDLFYVKMK